MSEISTAIKKKNHGSLKNLPSENKKNKKEKTTISLTSNITESQKIKKIQFNKPQKILKKKKPLLLIIMKIPMTVIQLYKLLKQIVIAQDLLKYPKLQKNL